MLAAALLAGFAFVNAEEATDAAAPAQEILAEEVLRNVDAEALVDAMEEAVEEEAALTKTVEVEAANEEAA